MKTTIVTGSDIATLVTRVGLDELMDQMIARLHEACAGFDPDRTRVRARDGYHYAVPGPGLLEWMPVLRHGEYTTVKMVGYHPHNPSQGLPTILSTISVYDAASGHLTGVADGTFLTALRTAAASAIASRILARPQSRVLGIIGCGAQAVPHIHALTRMFPISQILTMDIEPGAVASLGERLGDCLPPDVELREAPIGTLVQSADILCTATSIAVGAGPLFGDGFDARPWLHVNAIGSDFPGKLELPASLLRGALVVPDHREQCILEGECQQLQSEAIGPDLATLVKRAGEYAEHTETRTVFDSTGWALEDQVAMDMLLEYARDLDLGSEVALESISSDPLNPYHFNEAAERSGTEIRRATR